MSHAGGPLTSGALSKPPASQPSTSEPFVSETKREAELPTTRRQIPHPARSFEDAGSGYRTKTAADAITWAFPNPGRWPLSNLDVLFLAERPCDTCAIPAPFGGVPWIVPRVYGGGHKTLVDDGLKEA
ncbi:hypothetical protein SAMD00023353_5600030 [Rosellinia necatrix]|uniref:Uncharacterized protein n=1 Tax=Rosellinia necatrix TaxID=77044 RepID=A0A1S8A9Y2_ROSNE|nr:hypothetical protein SAMD00023353_5600030 [Rosellinia necatrix]